VTSSSHAHRDTQRTTREDSVTVWYFDQDLNRVETQPTSGPDQDQIGLMLQQWRRVA